MSAEFDTKVNGAINAHAQWMFRLKTAIETGKSEFDPTVVQKDNACEFGKWLYGEFAATYKTKPIYEEIRKAHAEFHVEASHILSLALKGQKAEALQAMGSGSKFKSTSGSLVLKLRGLKDKVI